MDGDLKSAEERDKGLEGWDTWKPLAEGQKMDLDQAPYRNNILGEKLSDGNENEFLPIQIKLIIIITSYFQFIFWYF